MSKDKKSTKERIFEAAVHLFSTKGYSGTSMRDLAKAVGIKESSLYNHYAGKDAILESVLEYYMEGFKAATAPPDDMVKFMTITDPLEFWLAGAEEYFKKIPPLMEPVSRILINEMFLDQRCRKFVLHSMFTTQKEFSEFMLRGLQEKGMIKDCDLQTTATQYVYMLQGLDIENKLLSMEGLGPEEIQKNIIKHITFFIEGLRK